MIFRLTVSCLAITFEMVLSPTSRIIAFVFIGDTITEYSVIEERMKQALTKLAKAVSETNDAGIQQPPTPLPND